ncbi:sugar ABC transporter substrate-binding protein [Paenibacillus beijingensis]|uniref:ABC transporter substrate-binding protein n=1 Tax=Paenibacillus beijingensis TaxID=1126833 RepID=A0A0D5NK76_9BACL|nr:maltose ABC transporter substrate-binding protein [Paenibacillus beijingensis]AJY75333.1 hypothetical protein VN24_13065 [Paenibacillus beijingensis]
MTRKTIVIALICMMVFTLAACGSNKSGSSSNEPSTGGQTSANAPAAGTDSEELKPEEGAELVLWTIDNEAIQNTAKEFEAKYNVKVKVENVMYWDSIARLTTDGPAGTGADVMAFNHDALGQAVKSGLVLPNDQFEEETKSNMTKQSIDASSFEGTLYGYPFSVFTHALYLNKDLVKDAKLDSWDDIKAFAKQFNDIPNNKFGFMYEAGTMNYNYEWMSGNGGYVFGNNGTDKNDIGINNEGAVKGMEFFRSLKEILPLDLSDLTADVKNGLWEQGKVAINMDGTWKATDYKKLPFEVGLIPLPAMPGGAEPLPFSGVTSFYVTAYTKYPNASRLLAHFLTTKESLLKHYEATGIIAPYAGFENEEKVQSDEIMQGFLKQVANTQVMPNIPEMKYFWLSVDPVLTEVWNGADIKTTLDKAAANMKASISSAK